MKDTPKVHYAPNICSHAGNTPRVSYDITRVDCRQCQMKNIEMVKHPEKQPTFEPEKSLEEYFV